MTHSLNALPDLNPKTADALCCEMASELTTIDEPSRATLFTVPPVDPTAFVRGHSERRNLRWRLGNGHGLGAAQ
jgi:hypothetical protein